MPAKSKKQQRFMGMVHAYQKGELKDAPESVKKAAGSMTKKAAKDFAETKHKGLPEKKVKKVREDVAVDEGVMKNVKRALTGKTAKARQAEEITKSQEASMKGEHKTSEKHFKRFERLSKVKEDVNVAEDFKSMTFKEYVELDEGAWDFIKGAGREIKSKVADKLAAYGQSGIGRTVTDIMQAGKEASAAGNLKAQLTQLAKLAQTAGGQAALKAALAQAAPQAAQKPAPQAAQKPAPQVGGQAEHFKSKPRYVPGQHGAEIQWAGLETPMLGKYLTDGVLDFAKGAGKAVGQKIAQSAPVRAGREVIQAGRQASAAADANKFATMAQGLIATIRKTPNGAALVKQMLEQMGALGKVLAQYLQQLANVKPAAPAGA